MDIAIDTKSYTSNCYDGKIYFSNIKFQIYVLLVVCLNCIANGKIFPGKFMKICGYSQP